MLRDQVSHPYKSKTMFHTHAKKRQNFSDCFNFYIFRSQPKGGRGGGGIVVRPYGLNQGIVVRLPADTKRFLSTAHRLGVRPIQPLNNGYRGAERPWREDSPRTSI